MSFHRDLILDDIHALPARVYANIAVRDADTAFHSIVANVNKIVRIDSPVSYYILTAITPIWVELSGAGGGGIPGGADTNIQFNNAGAFGGSANFLWNNTTKLQTLLGNLDQQGGTSALTYAPPTVGTVATGTNPRLAAVYANYVYVVDSGEDSLRIFDVTDPTNPEQIGTPFIIAGTNLRGIAVAGRYAYLCDATLDTFWVVDVIDKSSPVIVGSVVIGGAPRGVRVSGRTAFVTGNDFLTGITSIDISEPANPTILQQLNTTDGIRIEFDVVGNVLFVCTIAAANHVRTYDVTDPSNMLLLDQFDVGSDAWSIQVQGRYGYVLSAQDGDFEILDVSDPANFPIAPVGQVALGALLSRAVNISGNFAYIIEQTNDELIVVDVSDPTTPVIVGRGTIGANSVNIVTAGKYAYVIDNTDNNLRVIDIGGLQVQNANVSNIDAGNLNVRRDGIFGNNVLCDAISVGQGGILSDGDIVGKDGSFLGPIQMRASQRFFPNFLDTDTYIWQDTVEDRISFVVAADLGGGTIMNLRQDAGIGRVDFAARVEWGFGGLVASASTAVLSNFGNSFRITGTTTIDEISINGWKGGSVVHLFFQSGPITLTHNSGAASGDLLLHGDRDMIAKAGDKLTLVLNSETPIEWEEISRSVSPVADGVVQIFVEADFPGTATEIQLAVGTVYELMAPISTTRTIKHPVSGGAFSPATIRTASKETNTLTYAVGATLPLLSSQNAQGQLILQNLTIIIDAPFPLASVLGLNQTDLLTELDDTAISGATGDSKFEKCIFNMNNNSFLSTGTEFALIDCEANIIDAFGANFVDSGVAQFEIRERNNASLDASLITVLNTKLSSQPTESFFRIHRNLPSGSTILLDGVTPSPFTPGTGAFFGSDSGSVTGLQDSIQNPGTHTTVLAAGHTALVGDFVDLSGFVTQTQYNAQFVVTFVVEGTSLDVAEVFVATDTGNWAYDSLDQTDPRVTLRNGPPEQADSKFIGSMHVNGNVTVTVIVTLNTYTDFNLGGNGLASSNIERWSLTNTTTGELTYTGLEPFSGTILASISTFGEVGSPEYRFRAVKNGAVLPDVIETARKAGFAQIVTTALVVPISVVTGDTVRLQVNNIDDASDITIAHLSVSIQ